MYTPSFLEFNPQWLHFKLTQHPEYKMHFIDRAYHLLEEGGVLTPEKCAERMEARKNSIDLAIIGESARWGDAQTYDGLPMTKADWDAEVSSLMNVFFPNRTNILIDQLKAEGLYSDLKPPVIYISGMNPPDGLYYLSGTEDVNINRNNSSGSIYYTTNGKDPRAIGGGISDDALEVTSQEGTFNLQHSSQILARVKDGNNWSPLRKVSVMKPASTENYAGLKVTELNYNPLGAVIDGATIPGSEFEFIEFKNTGNNPLNISGVHLDSAVQYTVPSTTILMPGEYYVIADKPGDFYNLYGLVASGNFTGNFSNGGELVLLEDSMHNEILSFRYDDEDPWPELPDGNGYTLMSVEVDPAGNPSSPSYWTYSPGLGGNPFRDTATIGLDVPEIISQEFTVFPNPTEGVLHITNKNDDLSSVHIRIYNYLGTIVYENNVNGEISINLNELNILKGIYLVALSNENSLTVKKIIYH